ncbi:NAD(P)-dependent oxidoreductase [Timonella sp. A28]|uniref:NAD(P)-dependent oxidoreductase n=1 Tax=Timonella sp. A28 TaxID=3442640 RepID=UPI003EBFD58C
MKKISIIGISGKLGQHLAREALKMGYEVTGVCREQSVHKLGNLVDKVTIFPGDTNNPDVVRKAVQSSDGVLTVLVPWGLKHYSSGTARAVLEHSQPNARLIFSCGWHVPGHPEDHYSHTQLLLHKTITKTMRTLRIMDIDDQIHAARLIQKSKSMWTLVRASTLEEGPSQGMPVWAENVGHPKLRSDRTRRIDYAKFMLSTLTQDQFMRKSPAIVGCLSESALAYEQDSTMREEK